MRVTTVPSLEIDRAVIPAWLPTLVKHRVVTRLQEKRLWLEA